MSSTANARFIGQDMVNEMKTLLLLLAIALTGCATNTQIKPVEIIKYETRTVEKPRQILPVPDQIKMREVKWNVIQKDNKPYFALDAKNYENLSLNLNDLRAFMSQTLVIIQKNNSN